MVATCWSRFEGTSRLRHDARDLIHQVFRRSHDDRLNAGIRHRCDLRRFLDALFSLPLVVVSGHSKSPRNGL